MTQDKKPGFWGRLFGEKPQPKSEAQEAMERATEEPRGEEEALDALREKRQAPAPEPTADTEDTRDAAPPEMQAEWLEKGHPNPPEHEPPTPDDVTDPLERPDAIEDKIVSDPEEPAASEPEPAPAVDEPARPQNWLQRLSAGLKRSSDSLSSSIGAIFTKRKLDEATLQDLEDTLIAADLGIDTAMAITEKLRAEKFDKDVSTEEVREVLAAEVEATLGPVAVPLTIDGTKSPFVILMVGVNGSGKTTTIGKLTAKLRTEGKSVLLAAGDTFRAAAVEQLQVWGQRNDVEVMTRPTGADASGLAFDAVAKAQDTGTDVVIIDTAGRLQNRTELMDELEKIIRVIKKRDPDAPHATLLTLDATTGQNALNQVEIFGQKAGVTGLVMTKLDGTARGGILVAIARKFGLPIHFIGVGEAIGDLEAFRATDFARAIAGKE
ncbi:MAG TPA: signal recognition particle-docking protein FtsY [Pelagibacterium sp.]|uniref:signal recognition particle-docking protein FtsY n=1 Tax=uncultured Pelagibacterium sp. TaxID=1159875 RepID=UPI000C3888F6|nr:signal recognition particle-docking protein FtsY [Pelagibacterium sp.]HCO54848.1 signal recognition particle-docking protein FtsY [Pelagibacterium sp.]|tara:strand:- start:2589 stop:3899 length:1311 start_codon:yes stop_codon:yes gene_type:complete